MIIDSRGFECQDCGWEGDGDERRFLRLRGKDYEDTEVVQVCPACGSERLKEMQE